MESDKDRFFAWGRSYVNAAGQSVHPSFNRNAAGKTSVGLDVQS